MALGEAELFDLAHVNCEAPWTCMACGRRVCPRCEPSPNEPELCAECWWIDDPESAA